MATILAANSQGVGEVEEATSLANLVSLPAIRKVGTIESVVVAPLLLLKGADGKQIQLQSTDTYWQWRLEGEAWQDLISIEELKGLSAYELWLQEEGNEDKTYEDWLSYLRQPSADAKAEWNDTYKPDIDDKVALMEELNAHPTKVGLDNYVYEWSLTKHAYIKTDIYVKGDLGVDIVDSLEEATAQVAFLETEEKPDSILNNWINNWS
ncbi:hypothetical protein [Parabacteroides sp. Marseille-P3160]|uniref:hypothetical protein n=1 Tax=Parabacteroides sp. Marseille-P3160 TaxID=1917887 RepID=UPI001118274F|nr:hypothetical protein [Parabacteroides sp. Marseille-P3160]